MVFARVKVFASRDGDRVTGRVEFPYQVCGRSQIPIDYRSKRPDTTINPQSSIVNRRSPVVNRRSPIPSRQARAPT